MALERAIDLKEDAGNSRPKQHERRDNDHRYKRDNQRILHKSLTTITPPHKLSHMSLPTQTRGARDIIALLITQRTANPS
jgi:hypothetical protein